MRMENKKLFRDKKRIQKRIERLRQDSSNNCSALPVPDEPATPKSRTKIQMEKLALTPRRNKIIRRRLLFANVLEEELKQMKANKTNVHMSLKIIKKYRCTKALSLTLGVNWRTVRGRRVVQERAREARRKAMMVRVQKFLEREDNATVMPGKKDTVGKEKHQKIVLNDYMHNLHSKFLIENQNLKISRAQFCKLRPKHILLANFCNRNTCLCSRHQNMALKLRSLHNQSVNVTKNPDVFIAGYDNDAIREKLTEIKTATVEFSVWKKVCDGGKTRMKQVQERLTKTQFVINFVKEVEEFRSHVTRVKTRYAQMKYLRENLTIGHVMIWMDFAENFVCSAMEEIQSAYWNAEMVTLHTAVVYFPQSHSRTHMSIVGVSECLSHNANTVHAMIRKIVPVVRNEYPALALVHYLTDSPTSQYRNKTIFQCVCNHNDEFGVSASWDYLEAGHGKGPCDGLGASVKRMADNAIKQGKAVIQNAADFFKWVDAGQGVVTFFFVSQDEYNWSEALLQEKSLGLKSVVGTMKIHSVIPLNKRQIAARYTSCHCDDCMADVSTTQCDGWNVYSRRENDEFGITQEDRQACQVIPSVGAYVAAIYSYDGKWYVGRVGELDLETAEAEILFMHFSGKLKNAFRWPQQEDRVWVFFSDILAEIPPPEASGKSNRIFKLAEGTLDTIEELYNNRNK